MLVCIDRKISSVHSISRQCHSSSATLVRCADVISCYSGTVKLREDDVIVSAKKVRAQPAHTVTRGTIP
jgi:hypothetical protein